MLRTGAIDYFACLLPAQANTVPEKAPSAKKGGDQPDKVARLRALDREAMDLFKKGQQTEGFKKLTTAVAPYKKLSAADCTPEEVLAAAVIYMRIVTLAGKQLPAKEALAFITATHDYSERGGIDPEGYLPWLQAIARETAAAYDKK